ncbi:MAG: tetratricopeptide repeat protein [Pseudomonadales bacterium]|jgi:hypothetical protein|nr:tetratricopeptide repeat protein [Pseudomonadales bacterium]MDP7594825.1 tetratricopeptide repeat protein [Pseudomonadales bacterium]HJN51801.1 tetratricopeptide repeat protein [Pseudomonadales bacterium]|tara:strand:- start:1183 stop:1911 length:729 start_codon:yes stop_codon:yes gene_type:complete
MPLIILSVIIQVAFAVHVVKSGRDTKWLYFIVMFPLVGCVVYAIVELIPELLGKPARTAGKTLTDKLDPNRDMRHSAQLLEMTHNVDNAIRLAEQCAEKGHFGEAIEIYESSLQGLYKDDPKLLMGLAQALFGNGDFSRVLSTLDLLIAANPDHKSSSGHLLYARALEQLDKIDDALDEYEAVANYYPGPEAKYRYALLCKKRGRNSLADTLFNEIITTAANSPKFYTKSHREWIDAARREL